MRVQIRLALGASVVAGALVGAYGLGQIHAEFVASGVEGIPLGISGRIGAEMRAAALPDYWVYIWFGAATWVCALYALAYLVLKHRETDH